MDFLLQTLSITQALTLSYSHSHKSSKFYFETVASSCFARWIFDEFKYGDYSKYGSDLDDVILDDPQDDEAQHGGGGSTKAGVHLLQKQRKI